MANPVRVLLKVTPNCSLCDRAMGQLKRLKIARPVMSIEKVIIPKEDGCEAPIIEVLRTQSDISNSSEKINTSTNCTSGNSASIVASTGEFIDMPAVRDAVDRLSGRNRVQT